MKNKAFDAVIALWDSVVQNGKKIGISGALLPKQMCYNKLKHCNRPQSPRKREKPVIIQSFSWWQLNQLNSHSGWLQFNKHLRDRKNHFPWNFLRSQGACNKKKKKTKKMGSKTRHNMLQFGILGEKKMIEGFSKRTIQYAGYLIIVKGSSK